MTSAVSVQIVLPAAFAQEFGEVISSSLPGRIELIAIEPGQHGTSDLSRTEFAVAPAGSDAERFLDVLTAMPRLRWVHALSAGVERFLREGAVPDDVVLTNSAGTSGLSMAEYVVWGVVTLLRGFRRALFAQAEGCWAPASFILAGEELEGKRLGIVGYGPSARNVALVCKALGMEVWAPDAHRSSRSTSSRSIAGSRLTVYPNSWRTPISSCCLRRTTRRPARSSAHPS